MYVVLVKTNGITLNQYMIWGLIKGIGCILIAIILMAYVYDEITKD